MPTVTSRDGTRIDYDVRGRGPAVILVGGATQHRKIDPATDRLADLLSRDFTVINYDRRGRDRSGDTKPYAVAREIEDIDALIEAAGGRASLYGMSSGAVLAIEAASAMPQKVVKAVGYEPPVDVNQTAEASWAGVREQEALAARGDGAGAMAAFMLGIGMPQDVFEAFRQSPVFPAFAAVGHTIAYDFRILAEATENGLPERWRKARMPILILDGEESFGFMRAGADAVAGALPNASRQTLAGQSHEVAPEVLAPVLLAFLRG